MGVLQAVERRHPALLVGLVAGKGRETDGRRSEARGGVRPYWGKLDAHKALASLHPDPSIAATHRREAESMEATIHVTDEMLAPLLALPDD